MLLTISLRLTISKRRIFRQRTEHNKRDVKDIPVEEAANAVCDVLEEQFSLPKEDLIRAAANKMGFSRIGTSVSALFFSGITLAIKEKRIVRAENGNLMLK